MNGLRYQRGVVLVAVLWLVVLLTVMALGVSASSRYATRTMSSLVGATQARYLADGGVQLVLSNLMSVSESGRLLGDGETLEVPLPGGIVAVTVMDENGRVDINGAREELLARLLESLDVERERAESLAAAIADYRDGDELTRLNGAEEDDYVAAGLSWGPRNDAFTGVDELKKVLGMDDAVYRALAPNVTIYSRSAGVNPQVAPLQVLMAVYDGSVLALQRYVEQRRQNVRDGLEPPPPPDIPRRFLTRSQGNIYTLYAVGHTASAKRSGVTTTVRLRRQLSRRGIHTLNWQPYVDAYQSPADVAGNGPGAG